MPAAPSAGILLYRAGGDGLEVFIAHMGGPFWARKDEHAWSIPKGEIEAGEDAMTAARREFAEEIGVAAPDAAYRELGVYRYASGKTVTVFAAEAPDFELAELVPGTFELEWPPRSGRLQRFPEVDRAEWVPVAEARRKLVAGQVPALDAL
jgi:predicted NUDIX family NTP pyrophosphohydrolase